MSVAVAVEVGDGGILEVGVSVGIEVTMFGVIWGEAGVGWQATKARERMISKRALDFIRYRIAYVFSFTNIWLVIHNKKLPIWVMFIL